MSRVVAGEVLASAWLTALVLGCSSKPQNTAERGQPGSSAARPAKDTVIIKGMQFVPADIHANAGDTIVFVNQDIVPHDATETPSKAWTTGPIAPGQSAVVVARTSASYYCSIHQVMLGKITVR